MKMYIVYHSELSVGNWINVAVELLMHLQQNVIILVAVPCLPINSFKRAFKYFKKIYAKAFPLNQSLYLMPPSFRFLCNSKTAPDRSLCETCTSLPSLHTHMLTYDTPSRCVGEGGRWVNNALATFFLLFSFFLSQCTPPATYSVLVLLFQSIHIFA